MKISKVKKKLDEYIKWRDRRKLTSLYYYDGFSQKKLYNVSWSDHEKDITLHDISFEGSDLKGNEFYGTDLLDVTFVNSNLTGTVFSYGELINVNFTGANLEDVMMVQVKLTNAVVKHLYSPKKIGRKIQKVMDELARQFNGILHNQIDPCGTAGCLGAKLAIYFETISGSYDEGGNAFARYLGFRSTMELLIALNPYWPNDYSTMAFCATPSSYEGESFKDILKAWQECASKMMTDKPQRK